MKLLSRANSIKRIWADYSLRKFLFYAISPLSWASLLALKLRAKEEKRILLDHVSQWQNASAPAPTNLHFIFHPWLQKNRKPIPSLIRDELVVDSASPDPEIRMRLDRLSWVLQMAIHDQGNAWQAAGKWLTKRWKCDLACRGSYSISERVSNLILLWNIQEPEPSLGAEVLHMIRRDTDYLVHHLEYHGERGTNNHILNNARALVLAGSFLGEARFYEAGCWLIEDQLSKHVSVEGVLREASTHYQWVVTRWMVEVGCAFHSMDPARFLQLRLLLNNMLDVCEAMQLGNGTKKYLPLIGDISPDFPPRLYGGMTALGYALMGCGEEIVSPVPGGLWSSFFIGRTRFMPGNWQTGDGSWVRMADKKWSLLAHSDMRPDDNRATHGHHDLFSFELAFDGFPIVVDPGRKNYLAGRDHEEAGILEEWHNTILVDGKRTGFVARGYMPTPWLAKIRTQPHVAFADRQLEIRLDEPQEMPGIGCVQRVLNLADERTVLVSNRVIKHRAAPASVKLVMYVMGKSCLMGDGLKLEIGAMDFELRWKGLGVPVLRDNFRCVEYGIAEPCTRLEWTESVTSKEWESTVEIIAQKRTE